MTSKHFKFKLQDLSQMFTPAQAFADTPRWVAFPAHKYIQHQLQTRKVTPW